MKIALVDDEHTYIDRMTRICREFGEENGIELEIYAFSDGESFLASLDGHSYNIVFMDIFMNGTDGVAASKMLRDRDSGCILVFMTSCGERMPEAFSCHAFEYIVKPFDGKRVKDVLTDAVKVTPEPKKYMEIYSGRKNIRITTEDIVSAVTDAHYLDIELADQNTLRCRMTAKQFIEHTNGDRRFIAVNKGIIVNADYIVSIENNCCILENGGCFPIRVRDRLKIEQEVRDYNFDKIRSRQQYGR